MAALDGKTALVTGASAGIGAATARALVENGARVTLLARRRERLDALCAKLPGSDAVVCDVRDADALARALAGRRFDIAVANAGLARGTAPLDQGEPSDWAEMVDTNIKGVLHVVRAVVPAMRAHGRGDFVILGSVAGREVYTGGGVYCATKHAVKALYTGLRLDLAGTGLRFTTVDPGLVETEFSVVRFRGDADKASKVYQGLECLRPADVADAILYAVTRPARVNIGEIVLWPTDQASTTIVKRST